HGFFSSESLKYISRVSGELSESGIKAQENDRCHEKSDRDSGAPKLSGAPAKRKGNLDTHGLPGLCGELRGLELDMRKDGRGLASVRWLETAKSTGPGRGRRLLRCRCGKSQGWGLAFAPGPGFHMLGKAFISAV
ncbi:MAG: hypothetical protein AB7E65_11530, partial [Syntrophotalea sp.]|uniref:hypothetical protein n=1 Tax=Syntrophotalea sp. TaxID=2812029 RepID=UPI003D09601B